MPLPVSPQRGPQVQVGILIQEPNILRQALSLQTQIGQ